MKLTLGKVIFLLILISILFFPSYSKLQKLKIKDKALSEKVKRLEIENQRLMQENQMLKDDPVYIEEVAREKLKAKEDYIIMGIYENLPDNMHPYNFSKEECWIFSCGQKMPTMLASSHLICVSKKTGEIIYQGSANDEG